MGLIYGKNPVTEAIVSGKTINKIYVSKTNKELYEIIKLAKSKKIVVIELHCPKVDKKSKEMMVKAIRNNYGMDIDDADYDINRVNRRSLIYGLIGIIILIINLITEKYIGAVLSNFICVVWWVAIWEMVELQTIEKVDLRWRRLNYQQLYDSEITFVFDK